MFTGSSVSGARQAELKGADCTWVRPFTPGFRKIRLK